jgi:hypothetical protein
MRPIGQLSGTAPLHTFLSDPANTAIIRSLLPDEPVVGFRDALAALSGATTAELERLLGETLDVSPTGSMPGSPDSRPSDSSKCARPGHSAVISAPTDG